MFEKLYIPPHNNLPEPLPEDWRFEVGGPRVRLRGLSDAELAELGWIATEEPEYDPLTHHLFWNVDTMSYDIVENEPVPEDAIPPVPIDYKLFWDNLISSTIYTSLKEAASADLGLNTTCTEFLVLLADAKFGSPNQSAIQNCINQIFTNAVFTEVELIEVQSLFKTSGLDQVYTLA